MITAEISRKIREIFLKNFDMRINFGLVKIIILKIKFQLI